jgi:ribosomal protein S12 methylthiotransferase accessory factor
VEVVDDTTLLLLDELDYSQLQGAAYPLLAPLLDGKRTQEELFDLLSDKIFFPEISYALDLAEAAGHVIEGDDGDPRHAAFWNRLGTDLGRVDARVSDSRVTVEALGVAPDGALEALRLAGVPTGPEGNFHLVLTDDYMRPELEAINRAALASGRTWMLARPEGQLLWLGPVFRPARTACWSCVAQRLRMNRQLQLFLERDRKQDRAAPVRPTPASIPTMRRAALDLVATEVAKAIVLGPTGACLNDVILTIDSCSLESTRHAVVRRPQCAACGDVAYARREPTPVVLRSQRKELDNDGGHRTERPEATYERLKSHVDAITGVVRNLEPVGDGSRDGLTYSYSAGHNFAQLHEDLKFVLSNLRGRSGGKGMTDIQAKVSAIGESIERYSAVYRGDEIERRATYRDIAADAIHPYELMCFSEAQYRRREAWNEGQVSGFHAVPQAFDDGRVLGWTPAFSLTTGRHRWVLSAYCYFGHPDFKKWFCSSSDSNGNAAGNTIEEAILQGFLELVERDAVALWWYNRLRRPELDLDSFHDPYVDRLREHYRKKDRDLWVLDITSDLGIPTFAAVCRRTDHPVEDIVVGFGAHLDPRVALSPRSTSSCPRSPSAMRRATRSTGFPRTRRSPGGSRRRSSATSTCARPALRRAVRARSQTSRPTISGPTSSAASTSPGPPGSRCSCSIRRSPTSGSRW